MTIDNNPTNTDLVAQFMKMSRQKQLKFLQQALEDSAWRKPGAGVADDAAATNGQSLKQNSDVELRTAIKESFGVGDAALDRMVEVVENVTDAKAADVSHNGLVEKLKDLFHEYGGVFLDDGEADIVEQLCDRIGWLESEIAACEDEAEELRRHIAAAQRQKQKVANEEIERKRNRQPKRSYIEEDMLEPDDSNSIFLEENIKRHPNRVMQNFVDRVNRDAEFVKK